MIKNDITDKINTLKKLNWYILNGNSRLQMPVGLKGMPDYILMHKTKGIIFIEVKIGRDKYSEKQEVIKEYLDTISNKTDYVKYIIATEKNIDQIINKIITL